VTLIIERLNGTKYDLETLGMTVLDFTIDSPSPRSTTETIDGMSGFLDLETVYEGRTMQASFFMEAVDNPDFVLMRNEVFKIFDSRETFYLIDKRELGKRWHVKCNSSFSPSQKRKYGWFDVSFISPLAYSESIGTTLDPFTFDAEKWQIGQGLITDQDMIYTHSTTSFSIYNAGDITIDPREVSLIIEYSGASTNLKIKNNTTGEEWSYTGSSISDDVIKLDGVKSLKNNTSIFSSTNYKLITIKPGKNDFTLTGTSGSFTIKFNFRFCYL